MRIALALPVGLVALSHVELAAHDSSAAASPSGWDLTILLALAIAGMLYARGSLRLAKRGARVRRIERIAFWIGWAVMVGAVSPAMDRAAAVLFSLHMAQHELLMLVGAPLMIVGRPVAAWLWALPGPGRSAVAAGIQSGWSARAWDVFTTPVVACVLHAAAIWVWHLPALYEAAVRSEGVHAFQHATFVATSICFWWGLVYGRYGRAAYGASAFYVFITSLHTGVLGAMFTLSTAPYYGIYAVRAEQAGLDPVSDQQLAGLYMWIPAGVILTLFGLALLVAWLSEAERREMAAELRRVRQ